jgi:cell wall-associated NlpC family hydrolase
MTISSPTAMIRRATALPIGLVDRVDARLDAGFMRSDWAFDRTFGALMGRMSSVFRLLTRCADSLDLSLDLRVSKFDSRCSTQAVKIRNTCDRIRTAVAKLEARTEANLSRRLYALDRATDKAIREAVVIINFSIALTERLDNKITREFNRVDFRATTLANRAHSRQVKNLRLAHKSISSIDRRIEANLLRVDARIDQRLELVTKATTATSKLVSASALAVERVMDLGIARIDCKISATKAKGVATSLAISKGINNLDQELTHSLVRIDQRLDSRVESGTYRYLQISGLADQGISSFDEKLGNSLSAIDQSFAGRVSKLGAKTVAVASFASAQITRADAKLNNGFADIDVRAEALVKRLNGQSSRHASQSRPSLHRMVTALTLVVGTLGAATAASATSASQEPVEVDATLKYESSAAKDAVTQYLNVRESFQELQASRNRTIQSLEQEIAVAKDRMAQTSLDGKAVVAVAASYSGVPYVRGGTTPRGFDCSGFTSYVFAHFGLELPRTSQGQRAWADPVSFEDRQVGDLMFWQYGSIRHVGIYAGDGMMWDSPRSGRRVGKVAIWGNPTYGRVPASAINGPAAREVEAKSAELKELMDNAPQLPITIDEKILLKETTPSVPASALN